MHGIKGGFILSVPGEDNAAYGQSPFGSRRVQGTLGPAEQNRIGRELSRHFAEATGRARDTERFFRGEACMLPHLFDDRSMHLWNEHTAATQASTDDQVIADNAGLLAELGHEMAKRGPILGLERGPGGPDAVQRKTIPLTRIFNVASCIGMDMAPVALMGFKVGMANEPGVLSDTRTGNFNTGNYGLYGDADDPLPPGPFTPVRIARGAPIVAWEMGNTSGNLGSIDTDSYAEFCQALRNTRRHQSPGDLFLLGLNQRQARDTSYDNPHFAAFHMNMLKNLQTDLPKAGIDPEDFVFVTKWLKGRNLHGFGYRTKRNIEVCPNGTPIALTGNMRRYSSFSRRLKESFVRRGAGDSGYEVEHVLKAHDPANPWRISVLRAA